MRRLILTLFPLIAANQAIAHPSLMPHRHPHDVSALGGLDSLLLAVLLLTIAWSMWRLTGRS